MDNQIKSDIAQEPYEAPVVEDIVLHPEEQMLAGCKSPIGPSPTSAGNPCTIGACVTATAS
jgi:hypothetical protein